MGRKEEVVKVCKFGRMVKEFPFLVPIFGQEHVYEGNIESIVVARVDKNLLEVTPRIESHDDGYSDDCHAREFWVVTSAGEIEKLHTGFFRSQVPHGVKCDEVVEPMWSQLVELMDRNKDVVFIVEICADNWADGEGTKRYVVVYRMGDFNWRIDCQRHVNMPKRPPVNLFSTDNPQADALQVACERFVSPEEDGDARRCDDDM